ncbi:MAG: D-alanyl-D-alanine carboxypeptidase family protein [Patescibacteria group bacterium]
MTEKLLIIFSIIFNTFGFSGASLNIDRDIIQKSASSQESALAEAINLPLPEIKEPPKTKEFAAKPLIYAQNYILVDSESGTIIANKAAKQRVPIASTTKIMTAVVVLENYDLDEVVTISKEAASTIGASANLVIGEQMTVGDLLKCLLIKSANGAAIALAEYMNKPGETGIAKFNSKMNAKAKELGMNDTEYHDPAGLDVTGYSSAFDLYLITKYALKKPIFAEIVQIKQTSVRDITGKIWHELNNSNRLVNEWDYSGAIGVKTGYMPEAGHCLVGAATRNGHTLISIVLKTNADTPSASAEESRKLLDWGWQNIIWPR